MKKKSYTTKDAQINLICAVLRNLLYQDDIHITAEKDTREYKGDITEYFEIRISARRDIATTAPNPYKEVSDV